MFDNASELLWVVFENASGSLWNCFGFGTCLCGGVFDNASELLLDLENVFKCVFDNASELLLPNPVRQSIVPSQQGGNKER